MLKLLFTDFSDKDHFSKMNSLLAGVHADKLSDMFLSLFECIYPEKPTDKIKVIKEKIHKLVLRRNRFLHSKWFFDDTEGTVSRIKFSMPSKKNIDKDSGDITALAQLISEIKQINAEVITFVLELMKEKEADIKR